MVKCILCHGGHGIVWVVWWLLWWYGIDGDGWIVVVIIAVVGVAVMITKNLSICMVVEQSV